MCISVGHIQAEQERGAASWPAHLYVNEKVLTLMDLFLVLQQQSWVSLARLGPINRHVCVSRRHSGLQPLLPFYILRYSVAGEKKWMRSGCKTLALRFAVQSKPHLCLSARRHRDFTASPPEKGFPLNSGLSREGNVRRYKVPLIRAHNSCQESLVFLLHKYPYTL